MWKYIIILILLCSSCIEEYSPDISKYENVLVVDGKLTNLPGPYMVKLSRSYRYEQNVGQPVSGAQIKIIDNEGLEEVLKETDKGVYVTTDSSFTGIAGKSYKLQIIIEDEVFESEMETLIPPVQIDSVFWEHIKVNKQNDAIQLLVATHDPNNKTRYYGWDYYDTWKYLVPIDDSDHPDRREGYASSTNYNFYIASTINRHADIIERQPLLLIGEDINKLHLRYSILVTQYAYSEKAFKYLKDLVSLNQNQGSLFDPIPYSLTGNIKCVSDRNLPILGYFIVAGASEKRIFIDRNELPEEYRPVSGFEDCDLELVFVRLEFKDNVRMDHRVDSLMNKGYVIFKEALEIGSGGNRVHVYLAKKRCFDSRASGTNIKPDFWID